MAKWGIISTSAGYGYGEYTYTQDVANKKTYLNTYTKFDSYGAGGGSVGMTGQIQIGGNFYRGTASVNLSTKGTTTILTRSYTINHNADGSVPTGVGLQFAIIADSVANYSQHQYLSDIIPKINVGTAIKNNTTSNSRIDFDKDVTFTLEKSVATHTADIYYVIGDKTYNIAEGTNEDSISYSFPTALIDNFPDNDEPVIEVSCKALETNVIKKTNVYLNVPASYVPTISLEIEDVMENKPSALKGLWIKNKSRLKGTITATGVSGSTISSYLSSLSDFNQMYNTNPFTTQALSVSGARTVTSTVTDSRGRVASIEKEINVIEYETPSIISAKAERCLKDGTVAENGTYGKITCKYKISPINNLNTKTLTVQLDSGTPINVPLSNYEGEVSLVAFNNISQADTHTITFNLSDMFAIASQDYLLGIAYKTVSKRAGGKGITFGQVATKDGFNCYMDTDFYGELKKNGVDVATLDDLKETWKDLTLTDLGNANLTVHSFKTNGKRVVLDISVVVKSTVAVGSTIEVCQIPPEYIPKTFVGAFTFSLTKTGVMWAERNTDVLNLRNLSGGFETSNGLNICLSWELF